MKKRNRLTIYTTMTRVKSLYSAEVAYKPHVLALLPANYGFRVVWAGF